MLGHLREALLLASTEGVILAANVAGATSLGTSVEALGGASLSTFSPDEGALVARLQRALTGRPFTLRARDGRRFICNVTALTDDLLLLRLSGGPEPAPRTRAFDESRSRLTAVAAAGAQGFDEARTLIERTIEVIGPAVAGVFLLDEAGINLELKVAVNYTDEHTVRYRMIPLSESLPICDAVREQTPIFLRGIDDYRARFPEYTSAHPEVAANAFAALPLVADARCVGVIGLYFHGVRTFTVKDRDFLESFAAECTRRIALASRPEMDGSLELARAAQRLESLNTFSSALAQAVTPPEVTEAIVEMGMAATGARTGGLWLTSKDGLALCLARAVGANAPRPENFDHVPLERPMGMPIFDAVKSGVAVWVESFGQLEERYPIFAGKCTNVGEISMACIPLLARGRCIGGLVYTFDAAHPFLEDERAFMHVLSWYSAQAIERARLYAAEKRAREDAEANQHRSEFIADISRLLASSLDYSDILTEVARATVPRVADWCLVELADERLRGTPPVAVHADPAKTPLLLELNRRLRDLGAFDRGIAEVIRSGKSRMHFTRPEQVGPRLAAMGADPELVALGNDLGIGSGLVVPISARGAVLGGMVLTKSATSPVYDEQDLAMAEELGRRVGLAVDNARLYHEARDADRQKDEFLAMLSHELRNPLSPILTALDLMNHRGGEAFARERSMIARHLQHVVRLVDDLLDVSRITRGKVQLVMDRCEIASVVASAAEMARPLIVANAHRLEISVPECGLPVSADRSRLTQAITNLLTNAAKYTEPGGTIALTAHAEGKEAVIRVRDSGVGIAPELLPRIFDAFVQAPGSRERPQAGLGIGLTVAKTLVGLHGGVIAAHSEGVGKGSEFSIRLPLLEPETAVPSAAASEAVRRSSGDPWRVLVVDDNADAAYLLGEVLEVLGCSTRIFHDGPSALRATADFHPDLALLDIGLPAMDGYELARRLREMDPSHSLRLVALTGYGQASDRLRSREAGFDEHIVKPVGVDTLRRLIDRFRAGSAPSSSALALEDG
jgi:GAF domain-containing protein/CheY-like chemotaxis protein